MSEFELPYQPFFCEENIWSLIRMPRFAQVPCGALFISNKAHTVAMAGQKGADDGWIVWDYHVVLLEGGSKCRIWDPNSQRCAPEAVHQYLHKSFPSYVKLPLAFQPCSCCGEWTKNLVFFIFNFILGLFNLSHSPPLFFIIIATTFTLQLRV